VALLLLFLHMPGTFLPIVLLPEEVFRTFPFGLTLEGQYIVKNLVLIAAAIVIGGKIRHRMQGLMRFAPEEFTALLHRGTWAVAKRGETLVEQGEALNRVFFMHSGRFAVRVDGQEVAQRKGSQFVGEISYLTKAPATATVEILAPTRYLFWERPLLEALREKEPTLYYALLSSMNLDLITKLLRPPQLSSPIAVR
jgi:CRP-like cAMP-binding protein